MDATRLLLKNYQAPGDILMLTAAVRDLALCYPGRFMVAVNTSQPALWENNPYLVRHAKDDPRVKVIDCHYPMINQSNEMPRHFVEAFTAFLNDELHLKMKSTGFKGDVHLSYQETSTSSLIHRIVRADIPFWVIVAGGKHDYPIKWWSKSRWQQVVDYFKGRVCFVQVAEMGRNNWHAKLDGVIDLRGETTLRELVQLMYHAQGVVGPVTMAMHLAAAVETKPGALKHRPCVVVAGGREPHQFEAYPSHQFIHTIGAIHCCQTGGCWKSRVVPLGDGDEKDQSCCVEPRGDLPLCMDMISAEDVAKRIELYFKGGAIKYATPAQWDALSASGAFDPSTRGRYNQAKWPLPTRLLVKMRAEGDRGIGDIVARTVAPIGGDAFKKAFQEITGRDCNCEGRQEILNRYYPLK